MKTVGNHLLFWETDQLIILLASQPLVLSSQLARMTAQGNQVRELSRVTASQFSQPSAAKGASKSARTYAVVTVRVDDMALSSVIRERLVLAP